MSVKVIGYLVRHIFHNSVAIILALLLSLYVVTLLSYAFLQPVNPVDRSYQFDIKSSQSLIGWRSIWSHMSHYQFMTLSEKKQIQGHRDDHRRACHVVVCWVHQPWHDGHHALHQWDYGTLDVPVQWCTAPVGPWDDRLALASDWLRLSISSMHTTLTSLR